jgi:hypothetical protein
MHVIEATEYPTSFAIPHERACLNIAVPDFVLDPTFSDHFQFWRRKPPPGYKFDDRRPDG